MAKKFKKNDLVLVISGSDKGKTGKILSVLNDRLIVQGVNIATIHKKPTSSTSGQIVKSEKSVHVSNVSHIENGKPTKVKFSIDPGDKKLSARKIRVSKKTGSKIEY